MPLFSENCHSIRLDRQKGQIPRGHNQLPIEYPQASTNCQYGHADCRCQSQRECPPPFDCPAAPAKADSCDCGNQKEQETEPWQGFLAKPQQTKQTWQKAAECTCRK